MDDTAWEALDPGQRRQRTLDAVRRLLLREAREQAVQMQEEEDTRLEQLNLWR